MPLVKTFQQLCDEAKGRIKEVSTAEVEEALQTRGSAVLIDVREQDEFRAGHIPGALGIGRGILEYHIADVVPDTGREIILYCRGGNRSALAAESLKQMGYENVSSMIGGYRQWSSESRPESKDGKPIEH
jgi:sulfur-carrier protein adenylyltransferase/sulfurtransferase